MTTFTPFVARPLYGPFGVHYLSERACYSCQTRGEPLCVRTAHHVSSLLPDSFNNLLAMALNTGDSSHFVMLHGDIVPEAGWLSDILEECEAGQYDAISAVVPIKSMEHDDTSTAVGLLDGNKSSFRRIMTEESLGLPTTFTIDDVEHRPGDRLLINTGLFVIDLRKPWVEDWFATGGFRFETHAWRLPSGEWKSLCLPEDWLFSWDAQTKFGATLAATTKVRLLHYGEVAFANRYPASAPELQEAA